MIRQTSKTLELTQQTNKTKYRTRPSNHTIVRFDRLRTVELLRRSRETNRRWHIDEPAHQPRNTKKNSQRETQNKSETPQIGLSRRRSLIFISRPLCVVRTMLRSSFAAHLRPNFFRTFGSFFESATTLCGVEGRFLCTWTRAGDVIWGIDLINADCARA